MLAFAKDITQNKPKHPEEGKNAELKEYMDYQRKLHHEKLIYHALDHAKTYLQKNTTDLENEQKKLEDYLKKSFPTSYPFLGSADTILLMLRKLTNGHNSTNNWYRMNAYYYALVYDCMNRFIKIYNRLLRESPEKAKEYCVSEGVEVDFDDWVYLYFPDLDFLLGSKPDSTHYPFAKRNATIEEALDKDIQSGKSREEALKEAREKYKIDTVSLKILQGRKIDPKDLELFYTSVENPIYESLTHGEEGQWGLMDGESLIDHAYYMGSHLKIWEWRKREDVESMMDEITKTVKK